MTRSVARISVGRVLFLVLFSLACVSFVVSMGATAITSKLARYGAGPGPGSMANTLRPGDFVIYEPSGGSASGVRRGDIVMDRVSADLGNAGLVVKRVIGLPGDRVMCCVYPGGRMLLNGKPLVEPYLYPGDPPSQTPFSVTLGSGQFWLLGDHRVISLDSRQRGPVPAADIAGRVVAVVHGASFMTVRTPGTFVAAGLAPADTRPVLPLVLLLVAACSLVLLLVLAALELRYQRHLRRRPPVMPPLTPSMPGRPG